LFVITSGELHFDYHNRHFIAPEGTVVMLDCKQYHHYYSTGYVSFKFFHFQGSGSQAYCDMFVAMGNPVFFPNDFADINSIFLQMMYAFSVPSINIHRISLLIHTILCKLVAACQEKNSTTEQIVNEVVQYINDHYTEKLTVNQLASSCNLSVFYFIRLFERIHNCTPHEYILNMRLTHAKRLLLTTRMSVAEISVSVGFSTPSNFIRSFKSALSYTPHQFRTLCPRS
jgi:AraC family transcriptional regulator